MNLSENETPLLTPRFEQALVLASQLHAHQIRKGSRVPYLSHLMSVAALVLEDGGNEDEAIAALLHDAIEDQGGAETREQIRQHFGDAVVEIIDGCTETEVTPKPPWRERKQHHLDQLRQASPSVLRITLADKLHNARSILFDWHQEGSQVWERFRASREEVLWYYNSVAQIAAEKTASPLLRELQHMIQRMEKCT